MSELRERFHFAKLMLSQARYLSALTDELTRDPRSRASNLYNEIMSANGHSIIPSPINQAVFLQMAYVSLVWLSEALTSEQRTKIRQQFALRDFGSARPESFNSDASVGSYFRHLRNALAHASVDISGNGNLGFKFSGRNGETMHLSSEDLGRISEKWIFLVSKLLYPEDDKRDREPTC